MLHLILLGISIWRDLFCMSAPAAEKIMRALIVYLFPAALLRIFGKRELAQLNPFDPATLFSPTGIMELLVLFTGN